VAGNLRRYLARLALERREQVGGMPAGGVRLGQGRGIPSRMSWIARHSCTEGSPRSMASWRGTAGGGSMAGSLNRPVDWTSTTVRSGEKGHSAERTAVPQAVPAFVRSVLEAWSRGIGSVSWLRYQAASSVMVASRGRKVTPSSCLARWESRCWVLPSSRTRVPARVTAGSRRSSRAVSSMAVAPARAIAGWSAQAGVAGLGGGVGGGAGEGLAVAGQQQGGVDGVECRQGGEGGAAVVGEGA
jgi:hypothetical protein